MTGIVISNKMTKTIVVKVELPYRHPLYKKTIRRSHTFKARTQELIPEGAVVVISETRPLSRDIHFSVSKIISKPTLQTQ